METIKLTCHNRCCLLKGLLRLASALSLTRLLRITPLAHFASFLPCFFFSFSFFFPEVLQHGVWKEVVEPQASRSDRFGRQNEIYCSNVQGVRHCKRLHQSVQQVEGVWLALWHICNFSSGIASSGPLFTTPIRIY